MDVNQFLLSIIPQEQQDMVFNSNECDICPKFLGFVDVYKSLSDIIPRHFTVIDLGCAYAAQSFLFKNHKKYIGVDIYDGERFYAPNTEHHVMPIRDFVEQDRLNVNTTFAICSYVPPWQDDNIKIARENYSNVFTYYPCSEA